MLPQCASCGTELLDGIMFPVGEEWLCFLCVQYERDTDLAAQEDQAERRRHEYRFERGNEQ